VKKILLVDGMFPSKFTGWRNYEIDALLKNFELSVLVYKGGPWAGITYDFDWEYWNRKGDLNQYNILILDPKFNHLNRYNNKINGIKFNNLYPGSYIITKDSEFSLDSYLAVYHIFLGTYERFNADFVVNPKLLQFVHLYVGGGFAFSLQNFTQNSVRYVSSHPLTSLMLETEKARFIDCWGAPQSLEDEELKLRRRTTKKMQVSFSSMGYRKEKGEPKFQRIAFFYKAIFPHHNVSFVGIGNCRKSPFVEVHPPMDVESLENFYRRDNHVHLNLMSKKASNGWPLGLEAMKAGCVLITTDSNNSAKYFVKNSSRVKIKKWTLSFIFEIRKLYLNVQYWEESSAKTQKFFMTYCSYEMQQKKVIEYVNTEIESGEYN